MAAQRWDLFCAVVDNYGDAGVAWRLARQLVAEHGLEVRLWIDRPAVLAKLWPAIDPSADAQNIAGVEVRRWTTPFPQAAPADVVVETFGCDTPSSYAEAMAAADRPPVWINLDYLSAESWVEGCHGLASPHPRLPLTKHFFFPGFTPRTGGLIIERGLADARHAFQADARARTAFWRELGGAPGPGALAVSLFCYDTAPVAALLDAWAAGCDPLACFVPEATATRALEHYFRMPVVPGVPLRVKALTVHPIPFVGQDAYDRLLWACDLNFVRGEDSFVRAQLAARPLVWNAYPQAGGAHHTKLGAFLDHYLGGLAPGPAVAARALTTAWNGDGPLGPAWAAWVRERPRLALHADAWAQALGRRPDLACALVRFARRAVTIAPFLSRQARL